MNTCQESTTQQQLDEPFNADEIDDPYTTAKDKAMVAADIPERLQLKLEGRLEGAREAELQEEASWIMDKLTCLQGELG